MTPHLIKGKALGLKPPKVLPKQPSLRTLKLIKGATPPKSIPLNRNGNPQMLGNDVHSNCTTVGFVNLVNQITAQTITGAFQPIDMDHVMAFYSATSGYNPNVPGSDAGAVASEVLSYASRNGFDFGGGRTFYPLFGTSDPSDRFQTANIIDRMEGVYGGFGLAQADAYVPETGVWDTTTQGNQSPWSWGGHLMTIVAYEGLGDTDVVWLETWGAYHQATWRWVQSRLFEAHGLAFHQILRSDYRNSKDQTWHDFVVSNADFIEANEEFRAANA